MAHTDVLMACWRNTHDSEKNVFNTTTLLPHFQSFNSSQRTDCRYSLNHFCSLTVRLMQRVGDLILFGKKPLGLAWSMNLNFKIHCYCFHYLINVIELSCVVFMIYWLFPVLCLVLHSLHGVLWKLNAYCILCLHEYKILYLAISLKILVSF